MQGVIIENISNLYKIKCNNEIFEAVARGKLKKEDELRPVVGDKVQIDIIEEKGAVINKILERETYIKRPKIANISQIIFVVSTLNPKPDLLMLDKQICYAESLNINPIIVLNKIDLSDTYVNIEKIYKNIGYKVILTNAKEKKGIDKLLKELEGKISAFSGNSGVRKIYNNKRNI